MLYFTDLFVFHFDWLSSTPVMLSVEVITAVPRVSRYMLVAGMARILWFNSKISPITMLFGCWLSTATSISPLMTTFKVGYEFVLGSIPSVQNTYNI